ncbi:MAG: histidinol-phosphate transaminase [Bacteriovoracia bacterium]
MLNWTLKIPDNIEKLSPYVPGKPIEETEREFGISGVIKLASNENPLGPSPLAIASIAKSTQKLNLYPDASHYYLKQNLMSHLGCQFEELSIGNGSNEVIDTLIRAFIKKEQNIVTIPYAFVAYKVCAQLVGCKIIEAEKTSTYSTSIENILKTVDSNTAMVILPNPNNPTGTYFTADEISELASELEKKRVLFVLDCAYEEYVENKAIPKGIDIFRKHSNVVVLKTFSKIYGIAGLRVGYAIADKSIVSIIEKCRAPFNVSTIALEAAKAALDDIAHLEKSKKLNSESKKQLISGFKKLGLEVCELEKGGEGNFLLVDFKKPSHELNTKILKRGVIIRPVANYGLLTHFRVTCGLMSENEKLLEILKEVLK